MPITLILLMCVTISLTVIPELVELVVGQPFQYIFQTYSNVVDVQDASGEKLPIWLIWKKNER